MLFPPDMAHLLARPRRQAPATPRRRRDLLRGKRLPHRDGLRGLAMRLLTRRALYDIAFPGGGFEAETLHLKACLRAGVPVAWVPIPALYAGEPSSFRSVRDSLVVLRAAAAIRPRRARRSRARMIAAH